VVPGLRASPAGQRPPIHAISVPINPVIKGYSRVTRGRAAAPAQARFAAGRAQIPKLTVRLVRCIMDLSHCKGGVWLTP